MTQIAPTQFFDDFDNHQRIKEVISRDRYRKPILFLINHFSISGMKACTAKYMQQSLGIVDHAVAYQIMESFVILNMLSRIKQGKFVKYLKINPELWEFAAKEAKNG